MKYKLSSYNNFVEYNNSIICFNAMSGALFTISNEQYKLYTHYQSNLRL
jgi:hypothetical protein